MKNTTHWDNYKSDNRIVFEGEKKNAIGVIKVEGVIMDSQKIVENLQAAEKNPNIKGIILRIDSPGGAVGPSQEIYEEIKRIDEIKPVIASMGTVAASGGYYLAAATREIYANAGTMTGSIGVIMQFSDLSELYKFIKIKPDVVKAGKYKDIGSPMREMSEEERGLFKSMIDGVHQQFISDILTRRKDRIKGDLFEYAQGQIFSGEQALERGLVDQLGSLWKAGRALHEELKLEGELNLVYIKEKRKVSFIDVLDSAQESMSQVKQALQTETKPLFLAR